MSQRLPSLRRGIDLFPSPSDDHPGIVIRDQMRYTDAMLVIPPIWILALPCLDGEHTALDVQEAITRQTGHIIDSEIIAEFINTLDQQGFLETETFAQMRESKQAEFRDASDRGPVYSTNYPPSTMDEYFAGAPPAPGADLVGGGLVGIAAPHVSPEGGWRSYAAAYRKITPELADRVFVLLGTSHYGQPEKFGLTRKPYTTPLGSARVETSMLDKLVKLAPDAVIEEDYCHAVEHSIEFQVMFLQHVMQRPVTILPILCGAFADSLETGRPPESRFFDALAELAAEHGKRLCWILGIDMAHMGARYGHDFTATANEGDMTIVAARDQARLERICQSDARGFLDLVLPSGDDLNWCGYAPLYTFLRAMPKTPGKVLSYEQWNIDPQSIVSFGALEFQNRR